MQYARSKVDYVVAEYVYMLPSDMNLKIGGNIRGYNNKILVSSPSFNIGTNLKVNLDDTKVAKTEPAVKPKVITKPVIKPNKEHKQDVKPNRPDIKQNIEISRSKPDTNKITYEEEKAALILGMTAVFTVWSVLK